MLLGKSRINYIIYYGLEITMKLYIWAMDKLDTPKIKSIFIGLIEN